MIEFTRRRLAAASAIILPGLAARPAAALRIEPYIPKSPAPPPVTAVVAAETSQSGWLIGRGGWAYSQDMGWVHFFRRPVSMRLANWYGPPPPLPPPLPPSDVFKELDERIAAKLANASPEEVKKWPPFMRALRQASR